MMPTPVRQPVRIGYGVRRALINAALDAAIKETLTNMAAKPDRSKHGE